MNINKLNKEHKFFKTYNYLNKYLKHNKNSIITNRETLELFLFKNILIYKQNNILKKLNKIEKKVFNQIHLNKLDFSTSLFYLIVKNNKLNILNTTNNLYINKLDKFLLNIDNIDLNLLDNLYKNLDFLYYIKEIENKNRSLITQIKEFYNITIKNKEDLFYFYFNNISLIYNLNEFKIKMKIDNKLDNLKEFLLKNKLRFFSIPILLNIIIDEFEDIYYNRENDIYYEFRKTYLLDFSIKFLDNIYKYNFLVNKIFNDELIITIDKRYFKDSYINLIKDITNNNFYNFNNNIEFDYDFLILLIVSIIKKLLLL